MKCPTAISTVPQGSTKHTSLARLLTEDSQDFKLGGEMICHVPRWVVYTTNFPLLHLLLSPTADGTTRCMGEQHTQELRIRNTAQGDDTQCMRHPQTQLAKMTANGPRRITSQHMEPASAKAATHMSLRRPHEDVSILLEGALRLVIR